MDRDSQPDGTGNSGGSEEFKPGDTVSMRQNDGAPQPSQVVTPGSPSAQSPAPPGAPEEQHFFRSTESPAPDQQSYVPQYQPGYQDEPQPADLRMQHVGDSVSWTASEFIAHEKSANWYLALVGVAILITALVWLITRDALSVGTAVIVSIIFGYAASRKPREMQYSVDDHGITIGRRFYAYSNFRGFSVMQEGPFQSIALMPLKRFMPTMSIYFDPADEERILDVLAAYLPIEARSHDAIDRLMRRIRF